MSEQTSTEQSGSRMVCDHEDCEKGPFTTGHALYRVSPKGPGQKFIGLCEEHYAGTPDPVAKVIERANLRGRRS